MTDFDPATWIRDFEAAGGSAWLARDGNLLAGWRVHGNPARAQDNARRLFNGIADAPGNWNAVRRAVRDRERQRRRYG